MAAVSEILVLLMLFFVLGKAADLIVFNLRRVGEDLGLNLYFLGFVLGAFTSLPELAVGVNAVINNIPEVALGNLLGGVVVIFGLIFGASIVMHRRIETDPNEWLMPVIFAYFLLPVILGANGVIGKGEGALMIGIYLVLLALLMWKNRQTTNNRRLRSISRRDLSVSAFWVLVGVVLLIVLSNVIVDSTLFMLEELGMSLFVIGLIIYAIGTNLPEIIITFRTWTHNAKELSESNLVGSAMANVLIVGVLSFMKPITVQLDWSYTLLAATIAVLVIMLYFFWRSQARFVRKEGWFLISTYAVFLGLQILLIGMLR
jgi:cation:H+ antiporter